MVRVMLVGLALCIVGCGGKGSAAARKGTEPVLEEEKAAWAVIRENLARPVAVSWGPHDLDGRLDARTARMRKDGWEQDRIPGSVASLVRPGMRFVTVTVRHVKGQPLTECFAVALIDGKVVPLGEWNNEPVYVKYVGADNWIQDQLGLLDQWDRR